ncbi:MAG TPA: hypothetical protein PLV21_06790 [Cyclobacteriaceae bacterium]|nr:hypothetical protein [Cyclobacteriaceae bacterium]HRJ81570.1 hypothetical protein [Cyclobacteriaceae bacterium]
MKKLENIPKTNIFEVPEGYFDKLPLQIQARIAAENPAPQQLPWLRYSLRYALPMLVFALATIFVFRPKVDKVEKILASVSTEELVAYLESNALSTDELLDSYDFDAASAEAIEQEVYFSFDFNTDDVNEYEYPFEVQK